MRLPRRFVAVLTLMVTLVVAACGGGGGTAVDPDSVTGPGLDPTEKTGVFTGFSGDLDWELGSGGLNNEGIGGGADGGGGFGVGGALGQFRGALVKAILDDGTLLGEALTDDVTGMVTVRPPAGYSGSMRLEIHGNDQATYFEEGLNAYVPYGTGRVLRALVPRVERNVGITPFSEAGVRLALECQSGRAPASACGSGGSATALPAGETIAAANASVRGVLNSQFPSSLHVDDVTRLPFIVNENTPAGAVATDQRGRYGLVNVAFSKQAAMYNDGPDAPTLAAIDAFAEDLRDARLDGRLDGRAVVSAARATYDPHTWGSELSSALAQQTGLYGDGAASAALPGLVAFGNVRYDSYYFDARVRPGGDAATVAVATETASTKRTPGQVTTYVEPAGRSRGFMVYGNLGSGGLFIKTDDGDSGSTTVALGDNANGELGNGAVGAQPQTSPVALPGVLTHAAGGFGHTVFRLADGTVHAVGDNRYGQLGQGRLPPDLPSSTQPLRVPLPAGAVSVAATYAASFALLETGQVMAWGSSIGFGELGDGQGAATASSPQPVLDGSGAPLTDVVQLSARDNDVIALRADGTVWSWGSFSQTLQGTPPFGLQPGNAVATRITGLPTDGLVRKVLTEEGLFVALIHGGEQHGAVYAWGVHFDITAQDYLVDLVPQRVLNLPPLRDVMPGGFLGYGQLPSARTTGMGVDYQNRFWKLRGRVAERYDPADPTAQRRPQGQAPRADCASCHTIRGDGDPPPPPADAPVCVLPAFKLDAQGQPLLVNSASDCASCHNGNALSDGTVLPPLTCRTPALPPPPPPTQVDPAGGRCQLPIGHPDTHPGTFCASCHNRVVAPQLTCSADETPVPPPSSTTVIIVSATDDVGAVQGEIASGGVTDDAEPLLRGTISAPLTGGESVRVLRSGVDVGAASVSGTGWTFASPALGDGTHRFTARVLNAGGASGADSAPYDIVVATVGPAKSATIQRVEDDVAPQTGTVASGGSTNDQTPTLVGSLDSALDSGESLRLWRGDTLFATLVPQGSSWSTSDAGLAAVTGGEGDLEYRVQVISAAGVAGPLSAPYRIRFDNRAPARPSITASANAPQSAIPALQAAMTGTLVSGRGTMDRTVALSASFASGRADERVLFTMSSSGSGQDSPLIVTRDLGGGRRGADHTFDTGINLNGGNAPVSRSTRTFFARAVDAAGNVSELSNGVSLDFGFFACETLRAKFGHQSASSNCADCHDPVGPNRGRLDVRGLYWCTTGSGDRVNTPR